jgi:hypothetical protein
MGLSTPETFSQAVRRLRDYVQAVEAAAEAWAEREGA